MKKSILLTLMITAIITSSTWAAAPDGQEDICATAAVIMCDNFESRSLGGNDFGPRYKNNGWGLSNPGAGQSVISDSIGVYSGSKALQMRYPAGNNTGGGFMDINWTAGQTYYARWYTKYSSNFVWSPVALKHNELVAAHGQVNVHLFWHSWGDRAPKFYIYNSTKGTPWMPTQNAGAVTIEVNRWYCHETRVTMNTGNTSSDGYIQAWIDGVQTMEYPNVNIDTISNHNIKGFLLSSYWNCTLGGDACTGGAADTHPEMFRWHDNFVVSTERIGCLSGGSGGTDKTPPASPTNIRISSVWEWLFSQIHS